MPLIHGRPILPIQDSTSASDKPCEPSCMDTIAFLASKSAVTSSAPVNNSRLQARKGCGTPSGLASEEWRVPFLQHP
eukprot:scaffold241620_cov19-Tisochrysis_lutea.AAC.1